MFSSFVCAQNPDQYLLAIKNQLDLLSVDVNGLTENVKTEINVDNITLANFLLAISDVHKVNINVAPQLVKKMGNMKDLMGMIPRFI